MVTTKTHTSLTLQVYYFIKAVIRHRRMLITENKSTLNKMRALKIIEYLERNNRKDYTKLGAARFFHKNADDIRYLIKHDDVEKFNMFNQINMISKPLALL